MRTTALVAAVGVLAAWPLSADYLRNGDFKDGTSSWHGDGEAVYLKPDGTEGSETDTDVVPVLKLPLSSSQSHLIYQDIDTKDKPTHLLIKVDIFASSDFKRSTHADDYNTTWTANGTTWFTNLLMVPNADFWIRAGPGRWYYALSNLKPGGWTTVTGDFQGVDALDEREVNFCVPPGTGTIYLKNPSVNP